MADDADELMPFSLQHYLLEKQFKVRPGVFRGCVKLLYTFGYFSARPVMAYYALSSAVPVGPEEQMLDKDPIRILLYFGILLVRYKFSHKILFSTSRVPQHVPGLESRELAMRKVI